jgi:hypothetical protein
MAAKLNRKALTHARKLIESGKVVRDVRDDWSEHAPSTNDENAYIDKHGFAPKRPQPLFAAPETPTLEVPKHSKGGPQ